MEVELQRVEQIAIDKDDCIDWTNFKVRKVNKTARGLFGTAMHNIAIDNTYKAEVLISVKQGGEYRSMPYRLPKKGFCDFIEGETYFYPDIAKVSDFPKPLNCPMRKVCRLEIV